MSAATPPSALSIPAELVDFFEAGVSILVGTCHANLRPEGVRAIGAKVSDDRSRMTIFLNQATADRTLSNVATNLRVAVCFCRPIDSRSIQVKGRILDARPAYESEKRYVDRYISSFVEALYLVNVTRAAAGRIAHWPSVALEMEVEEMFLQTPGVGAGARLG